MKILVGTNCLTEISPEVYGNHCQFWSRTTKSHPEDQFIFFAPRRMSIDNMRNAAAKLALEIECEYLMFIDDDMLIEPTTFASLRDCDLDIVMALTFIRGYPFEPMFFKFENPGELIHYRDWKDHVDDKGIVRCGAVGFATVLIKTSILKDLKPPFFVTGTQHTEDVYFCIKAQKELNNEVTIGVDTKVPTMHRLNNEFVSVHNVEELRKFYALTAEPPQPPDRTKEDIEKCLSA